MDPTEFRLRIAEALLAQHRHRIALRHSDLQRRFVFALGVAAALVAAALRDELPWWSALGAAVPLAWAWRELRKIDALLEDDGDHARTLLSGLHRRAVSEDSSDEGADEP